MKKQQDENQNSFFINTPKIGKHYRCKITAHETKEFIGKTTTLEWIGLRMRSLKNKDVTFYLSEIEILEEITL